MNLDTTWQALVFYFPNSFLSHSQHNPWFPELGVKGSGGRMFIWTFFYVFSICVGSLLTCFPRFNIFNIFLYHHFSSFSLFKNLKIFNPPFQDPLVLTSLYLSNWDCYWHCGKIFGHRPPLWNWESGFAFCIT